MTTSQRKLLSKGLIDLANIVAGALIFGQFISGIPINFQIILLGVIFTITFYLWELGLTRVKI